MGASCLPRRYPKRGGASPISPVHIDAQAYLDRFYASFGFTRLGEPFDED